MKGLDILLVRFLPFILFIQVGITIIRAFNGLDDYPFNLLHSNSAIYATVLFLISLANKRYHCVWNRAMYAFLIFIPIFNFLDGVFNLFPEIDTYFIVIYTSYGLTALITAYLAIRHFVQISKRRMARGRE